MTGLTAYAGLCEVAVLQGGRRRLRLRRRRCRRQPGRPDRQAQGRLAGHRLGRLRREGQAPRRGVRLRRRLQLQERPGRRAAARGRPRRHRRLLRQRRRRAPGGRDRLAQRARPRRRLRHDLPVQRDRADPRPAQPRPGHRQAAAPRRASSSATTTTSSRSSSRRSAGWLASGELKYRETVVEGIENDLEAFLGVLRGDNTGKMIVSLGLTAVRRHR